VPSATRISTIVDGRVLLVVLPGMCDVYGYIDKGDPWRCLLAGWSMHVQLLVQLQKSFVECIVGVGHIDPALLVAEPHQTHLRILAARLLPQVKHAAD
jgi:hypothetical protein